MSRFFFYYKFIKYQHITEKGKITFQKYIFHFLLPVKNKFHILSSKYYHCFVMKDTRVVTTKLPENQTHNNDKINHKNIQIKIICKIDISYLLWWLWLAYPFGGHLGRSPVHGKTHRGGLVLGYGQEMRENCYWCFAMFWPSVSAHISAQLRCSGYKLRVPGCISQVLSCWCWHVRVAARSLHLLKLQPRILGGLCPSVF